MLLRRFYFTIYVSLLQEKYLLSSPDVSPDKSFPLPVPTQTPAVDEDQWASCAAELLSGLTDENQKLVEYMVPWDPWVYQQLFNPSAGGAMVRNILVLLKLENISTCEILPKRFHMNGQIIEFRPADFEVRKILHHHISRAGGYER